MSALLAPGVGADTPLDFALKFDRRNSPRIPVEGFAMVAFGDAPATRLTPVHLIDASDGGLGVHSTMPVFPGTPFALYCPGSNEANFRGEVARCTAEADGFRLGLCYDGLKAA